MFHVDFTLSLCTYVRFFLYYLKLSRCPLTPTCRSTRRISSWSFYARSRLRLARVRSWCSCPRCSPRAKTRLQTQSWPSWTRPPRRTYSKCPLCVFLESALPCAQILQVRSLIVTQDAQSCSHYCSALHSLSCCSQRRHLQAIEGQPTTEDFFVRLAPDTMLQMGRLYLQVGPGTT